MAAFPNPWATSMRWQAMDRAPRAEVSAPDNPGDSVTRAHERTSADASSAGGRLVEDGPESRIAAAPGGLVGLGLGEGTGDDGIEDPGQRRHLVAAHHLEEPGLVHHRHLGTSGKHHPAAAPPEFLTDQVRADRPEILGPGHREEGDAATARLARLPGPLEGRGHHPGGGDRRHGVDRHPRRRVPAQLPGEGGHRPLGAAVGPGVGGPPPRARGDAEDAPVAGGGHERQRGIEHVEVAVEVHGEHCQPVLFGAAGKIGLPGDAGHIDDGVESAVLLGQLVEQGAHRLAVGHRQRRGPGRTAGGHDTAGGGLLGLGEPLRAVKGHQGIDGDHEPATAAELLGDGRSDPASAAGHDGDPPAPGHDGIDRTSSSSPSSVPASSHCSSSSR